MKNINVRILLRKEFIKKDYNKTNTEQQCKLILNGLHKSYENCDSYLFEKKEVLMDKPNYLGFAE